MAKKRNQSLRPMRDTHARKKMSDGKSWAEKMMEQLKNIDEDDGVEQDDETKRRKKGARCNAKRHTSDSL